MSRAFPPLCLLLRKSWAKWRFTVKCLKLIKWQSTKSWFQSSFPRQHFANLPGEHQEKTETPLTSFPFAPENVNPVFLGTSPHEELFARYQPGQKTPEGVRPPSHPLCGAGST